MSPSTVDPLDRPHVWQSEMVPHQRKINYRCRNCGRGPFTEREIVRKIAWRCEARPTGNVR